MIDIRPASQRGHANHGWLDSFHTFSFGEYFDTQQMGWGVLRVINDDTVVAGRGFGTHGHRDMEIMSYVLQGELEHKDSMGTGSVIRPGDVQLMSAGTGVRHSEFNPSSTNPVHFLQIWIEPAFTGTRPSYQQRRFDVSAKRGRLQLIVSPDGRQDSLTLGQDARVYAALLDGQESISHPLDAGRRAYVHVAQGSLNLNGQPMSAGDGAKVSDETVLVLDGGADAEVLLFDLP